MATKVEQAIRKTIAAGTANKPDQLICQDLHWRFGLRAILRGENLMLTGPTGSGKDLFVASLAKALKRETFYIPFGATQDPRSSIIGNTHYRKDSGTFTQLSYFAQAIQRKNAVVIFDEMTRAHPEVQNLLMTVLDMDKRWLRIDEDPDTPKIEVAEGVSFLATANIGAEYVTTRGLDRAFMDRWSILELPYLSEEQELQNITACFPELDEFDRNLLVKVVCLTREEMLKDAPQLDTALSTRVAKEMAALMLDGFSLTEAIHIKAYPFYSTDGNPSPRQAFLQLIQAHMPDVKGNLDPIGDIPNNAINPF